MMWRNQVSLLAASAVNVKNFSLQRGNESIAVGKEYRGRWKLLNRAE